MAINVEELNIEITSSATSASTAIESLVNSLEGLKGKLKEANTLKSFSTRLEMLNVTLDKINSGNIDKLRQFAQAIGQLKAAQSVTISPALAKQITAVGDAMRSIDGANFALLPQLATSLAPLSNLGKTNLGTFIKHLQQIPAIASQLNGVDMGGLSSNVRELASAFIPLGQMGKNNLKSFIDQIGRLPEMMRNLKTINLGELGDQLQRLANAFAPLGTQMQSIAMGFAALPSRIQKLIQSTDKLTVSNNRATRSYGWLVAKATAFLYSIRRVANTLASFIDKSNQYIENMNLFNVAMGEYASAASKYAYEVGEIMGIDPGEWMRYQGVFMTLAKGFGVAGDRANLMSQQLTQLGYDLSSFFNISYEDAMLKLQSGLAGELEPLRRIGYDLSVARLQQEAYTLGIQKHISEMTQAEKAELRYYAIMTQVTDAQGDMARTLNAPANQLRIFKAQIEQTSRAIGNLFIPILNKVLPYLIAAMKVLRIIVNTIAKLLGVEIAEMTESSSALSGLTSGAEDFADGIGDATDEAKKLRKTLIGLDELNIFPAKNESSANAGDDASGGSGFTFDLPTYDFIGDAVNNQIDEIVDKMKEWLGITDEITSWSELFDTKLGDIFKWIGLIGTGLLGWKLGKDISKIFGVGSGGKVAGAAVALYELYQVIRDLKEILNKGLDKDNFLSLLLDNIGLITGLGLAFGWVGLVIGVLVMGISSLVAGLSDFKKKGKFTSESLMAIGLGAIYALGPIGSLIGGIILFTKYPKEIKTAIEPIKQWFDQYLIQPVEKAFDWLVEKLNLGGLLDEIKGTFEVWVKDIGGILVDFYRNHLEQPIKIIGQFLWDSLKESVSNIGEFLKLTGLTLWNWIKGVWNTAVGAFEVVWATMKAWGNVIKGILTGNFEDAWEAIKNVWEKAKKYFKTLKDSFISLFEPLGDWFGEKLDAIQKHFDDFKKNAVKVFTDMKSSIKDKFDAAALAIKQSVGKIFRDFVNAGLTSIEKVFNNAISWINNLMYNVLGTSVQPIAPVTLDRYAQGGYPTEGELFIAREAGAEMVGSIGNHTAVANNDQIVAAVSQGVYSAVLAAMSNRGEDRHVKVYLDGREITSNVVKRVNDITMQTGASPLYI